MATASVSEAETAQPRAAAAPRSPRLRRVLPRCAKVAAPPGRQSCCSGWTDDNLLFARSLEAILADDERFDVVGCAQDGEEAVELAESLHPDVVLMDITMPRIDGLQATRRLRERGSPAHVVVLTQSDLAGDVLRAKRAGADGYVAKTRIVQGLRAAILEAAG